MSALACGVGLFGCSHDGTQKAFPKASSMRAAFTAQPGVSRDCRQSRTLPIVRGVVDGFNRSDSELLQRHISDNFKFFASNEAPEGGTILSATTEQSLARLVAERRAKGERWWLIGTRFVRDSRPHTVGGVFFLAVYAPDLARTQPGDGIAIGKMVLDCASRSVLTWNMTLDDLTSIGGIASNLRVPRSRIQKTLGSMPSRLRPE